MNATAHTPGRKPSTPADPLPAVEPKPKDDFVDFKS